MSHKKLLISNVDGTLLGNDAALHRFAEWFAGRRGELGLVYNSGRSYWSVRESVEHTELPEPDAVIGGVGTDIRLYPQGERLGDWPRRFRAWNAASIRSLLDDRPELTSQPAEHQSAWKVSYYGVGLSKDYLNELRRSLGSLGYRVNVVYSVNSFLDVVPAEASKGTAAAFLATHWGVSPQQVFVCGDSGNDLSMFHCRFRGIVVANGHPELRALNNAYVYQSSKMFADGVIDGMQYWLDRAQQA